MNENLALFFTIMLIITSGVMTVIILKRIDALEKKITEKEP